MEKKQKDTYKETYPKELYEIIVEYAKKNAEISKRPLIEVIKEKTPIYFFIGNYTWDFDPNSKFSVEFEKRVREGENIAKVVHEMQNKNYKRSTSDQEWFGCFRYKYKEDRKTGERFVKIHFRNVDKTALGPLAHENKEERMSELTSMFKQVKADHPEAEYVQGGTWLYNYDSYCRLFPASYTTNMKSRPPQTHYMIIWGQFINSEGIVKDDLRREFYGNLEMVKKVEDLALCFKYQELIPRGPIKDFYSFYGIN